MRYRKENIIVDNYNIKMAKEGMKKNKKKSFKFSIRVDSGADWLQGHKLGPVDGILSILPRGTSLQLSFFSFAYILHFLMILFRFFSFQLYQIVLDSWPCWVCLFVGNLFLGLSVGYFKLHTVWIWTPRVINVLGTCRPVLLNGLLILIIFFYR